MTVRTNTNAPSIGQVAARIMMLERAREHLGLAALAAAMGIGVRALQYKLATARGVTDVDLTLAAAALEGRAAEIVGLAATMRGAA